jgi:hypothetical protein
MSDEDERPDQAIQRRFDRDAVMKAVVHLSAHEMQQSASSGRS